MRENERIYSINLDRRKGENLMRIFKKVTALLVTSALAMSFVACGSSDSDVSGFITGSGSSALLPLAKEAAVAFKEKYPDVSVTLNGGGSGTGLKQVSDGSVDIGNSDVPAEEKLSPERAKELVAHKVCVAIITPVVNKELAKQVPNLTKQQLIDIFTGTIKNWSEVGGPDEEILLITRPQTSGTKAVFQKYALDGNEELVGGSLETDDSGTLLQTVADNKGAIGYVSLSYLVHNQKVSTLKIDGVEPSLENTLRTLRRLNSEPESPV